MKDKLFDSEAKAMEIIWEKSLISAKEISLVPAETIGWNKNTTYTVINKLEATSLIKKVFLWLIPFLRMTNPFGIDSHILDSGS